MPSDYTHLYFGRKAMDLLPPTFASAVKQNQTLFNIGLQGPDILFFYEPLHKCPVNQTGYTMHDTSAKEFFFPTREILKTVADRDAALSYLAGFLCHYTLDVTCHGYIEKKMEVSGLRHSELEKEFDRYLMEKTGDMTKLVPSAKNASVIAAFFPDISEKQILTALRYMNLCVNLLSGRGLRRPFITAVLKISGQYGKLYDMIIPKSSPVGSTDSNMRLEKLLKKALNLYSEWIRKYDHFLQGAAFPEELTATFGPDEHWREIPILSPEEEKLYEV